MRGKICLWQKQSKSADENKKINFDNVAGLDEEKEELQELVQFLKEPKSSGISC